MGTRRVRKTRHIWAVVALAASALAQMASAQTAGEDRGCAGVNDTSSIPASPARCAGTAPGEPVPGNPVLAEIEDPATGARWLLELNGMHPEGPGRLVRLAGEGAVGGAARSLTAAKVQRQDAGPSGVPQPIVIHEGDRVVIEEHSTHVDARLEAVALGPAMRGGELKVRLKIGGKVVRAVAAGVGRAELIPAAEARP